jgi:fermentation-respiration switch protein FrsA (DUF1100 family)
MAPRYDELRVPLVMVHGMADQYVPVEQARRLYRAAPDSVLIEIPEAGHELMFVRPTSVMEGIATARAGASMFSVTAHLLHVIFLFMTAAALVLVQGSRPLSDREGR